MSESQPAGAYPAAETVRHYRKIEELIPSHWSQGTTMANGIRQHYYRTGGDKPPLVLLHGFLEGALSWLRAAQSLEPDYDVIMIDARGHGRSEGIAGGFSQSLLNEDATGAMRMLRLGAARVLGFSQGGGTGIHIAAGYPEMVSSLIVEGWGDEVRTDFTHSEGYQAWYNAYLAWLEGLKAQTHAERMLSALTQLPPGAPIPPEDEYVAWVENCANLDLDLVKSGPTMWADLGARTEEIVRALARVTCPVLIMKSSFFPQQGLPRSIQEEASERANVRIVRFVNTGHVIHQEQFEAFIALVKDHFGAYR